MVQRVNVRIGGGLGSGPQEEWSIGLNYGNGGVVLNQEQAQEVAEDIADLLAASATPFGSLANGSGAGVSVRTVEVYSYGTGPAAVAKGESPLGTPRVFTGGTSAPPQTTACITLLTALPGRSYRGRVYWPQLAPVVTPDLKSSTAKDKHAGLVTLNTAISNVLAFYGPFVLCVYSRTLDVVTPVTSVRSGDVLDTQRRRRDALTETFSSSQIP